MKQLDGWWLPDHMTGIGAYLRRSQQIEPALKHHIGPTRFCMQAGGHLGVWPIILAKTFEWVTTFEPEEENFRCLAMNIDPERAKITAVHGALAEKYGTVELSVHSRGSGSHHLKTAPTAKSQTVTAFGIDAFNKGFRDKVDAIFLDIEGYELHVLRGARKTLLETKPTLVIEENGCGKKYGVKLGDIEDYLLGFGYKKVGTYGEDIVLVAR